MPEVPGSSRQETKGFEPLKRQEFDDFLELRRQKSGQAEFNGDELVKEAELFSIQKKAHESAVNFVKEMKMDESLCRGVETAISQMAVEGNHEQLRGIIADLEAYYKSAEQVAAKEAELKGAIGAQTRAQEGGTARTNAGVDRGSGSVVTVKEALKTEKRQRWLSQDEPGGARWDGLYRLTDAEWAAKQEKLATKEAIKTEKRPPLEFVEEGEKVLETVPVYGETVKDYTDSLVKLQQLKAGLIEALMGKKEISNDASQWTFGVENNSAPSVSTPEVDAQQEARFVGDEKGNLADLEADDFAVGAKIIEEKNISIKEAQNVLTDEKGKVVAVESAIQKNSAEDQKADVDEEEFKSVERQSVEKQPLAPSDKTETIRAGFDADNFVPHHKIVAQQKIMSKGGKLATYEEAKAALGAAVAEKGTAKGVRETSLAKTETTTTEPEVKTNRPAEKKDKERNMKPVAAPYKVVNPKNFVKEKISSKKKGRAEWELKRDQKVKEWFEKNDEIVLIINEAIRVFTSEPNEKKAAELVKDYLGTQDPILFDTLLAEGNGNFTSYLQSQKGLEGKITSFIGALQLAVKSESFANLTKEKIMKIKNFFKTIEKNSTESEVGA